LTPRKNYIVYEAANGRNVLLQPFVAHGAKFEKIKPNEVIIAIGAAPINLNFPAGSFNIFIVINLVK
jgi:hypothetical protein